MIRLTRLLLLAVMTAHTAIAQETPTQNALFTRATSANNVAEQSPWLPPLARHAEPLSPETLKTWRQALASWDDADHAVSRAKLQLAQLDAKLAMAIPERDTTDEPSSVAQPTDRIESPEEPPSELQLARDAAHQTWLEATTRRNTAHQQLLAILGAVREDEVLADADLTELLDDQQQARPQPRDSDIDSTPVIAVQHLDSRLEPTLLARLTGEKANVLTVSTSLRALILHRMLPAPGLWAWATHPLRDDYAMAARDSIAREARDVLMLTTSSRVRSQITDFFREKADLDLGDLGGVASEIPIDDILQRVSKTEGWSFTTHRWQSRSHTGASLLMHEALRDRYIMLVITQPAGEPAAAPLSQRPTLTLTGGTVVQP